MSCSRHVRDESQAPWVRRRRDPLGRCAEPLNGGGFAPLREPMGRGIRRKVSLKTKQEVRAKLQALHQEVNAGVRSSSTYTVREAVDDWLSEGLDGTSERTRTLHEGLLEPVPWRWSALGRCVAARRLMPVRLLVSS